MESVGSSNQRGGAGRSGLLDRLLEAAGERDPRLCHAKLRAFRSAVLLYGGLRSWLWLTSGAEALPPGLPASAAVLSLCFALSLFPRTEVIASRVAVPVLLIQLIQTFPLTHNHFFLELMAVTILSIVGRSEPCEEALALQGLQWLCAIVLFHIGVQKVLYGLYFQGELLAFMVGQTDRFASLFAFLLEEGEVERLRSYNVWETGAGPYQRELDPVPAGLESGLSGRARPRTAASWFVARWNLAAGDGNRRRTRNSARCARGRLRLSVRQPAAALPGQRLEPPPAAGVHLARGSRIGCCARVAAGPYLHGNSEPMSGIERDEQRHLQKKRAVLGLLLFVAVWPLLHRALVVRFDVNP